MAPKLAFAASILASLAACSPPSDPSGGNTASGDLARSRAKWPLPAEPVTNTEMADAGVPNTQSADTAPATPEPAPEKLPDTDPAAFRARGAEPFWAVTVIGGTLVLDRPGKPSRYFPVRQSTAGGTLRYSGDGIQLGSTPGDCDDGMSERAYGYRVQIALDDGVLKGCGIAGSSVKAGHSSGSG